MGQDIKNTISRFKKDLASKALLFKGLSAEDLNVIYSEIEDLQKSIEDVVFPQLIDAIEKDNVEYQKNKNDSVKLKEELRKAENYSILFTQSE